MSDHAVQTQVEYQSPPGHTIPQQYLQQSSATAPDISYPTISPHHSPQHEYVVRQLQNHHVSEIAHIDSILRTRRMELHDITAALLDRRKEFDALTEKCKRENDRLRVAEQDASTIEKRASDTSKDLVHASNQLLDIGRKSKTATEKLDQLNQKIEVKTEKLREVEMQYDEANQKAEKVNNELESKNEQLKKAEKDLEGMQEKLKLSLKLSELRDIISTTERVEHEKNEKRVSALKDGEKILVERTSQLARTRNELQKQTAEYYELNANIAIARKDLTRLEQAVKKKNVEIEELAAKREEERAYHENVVLDAEEKLEEIKETRNDVLTSLRRNRDELLDIRESIQTTEEKARKLQQKCTEKEEDFAKLCQKIVEQNALLETLNIKTSEKKMELNKLEVEVQQQRNQREQASAELASLIAKCEQQQHSKDVLQNEIQEMEKNVNKLQRELLSNETLAANTLASLAQAQEKLAQTEETIVENERNREVLSQDVQTLKSTLTVYKVELDKLKIERNEVLENLQQEQKKFQETKTNYEEFEAELKTLQSELERRQAELKKELDKENNTEPAVSNTSGINPKPMRRKRQGAKLPIVDKSMGLGVGQARSDETGTASSLETLREMDGKKGKHEIEDGKTRDDTVEGGDTSENTVFEDFQARIQELTTEKDKTRQALKKSVLEVKRLRTEIENEKQEAQSTVEKIATEANNYRRALEHLKMEFAQYQQRATRDVEYLRVEAAEQYSIANALAQELSTTKQQQSTQNQILLGKEEESQQTFTRDAVDAVATQIKSEIIQSLKEIEESREDAIEDITRLKQAKDDIEMQLVALQQTVVQAQEKKVQQQRDQPSHQADEEMRPKERHKSKVFLKEQCFLKDQMRKQMSRRAEILEEERKKAGQSLEGLKNKLQQLEKVITRKDSTVQDFRLELTKTRLEKERSDDKEKELDDLRRRLQEVEIERDLAKNERDHLATLSSHVPNDMVSIVTPGDHLATLSNHVPKRISMATLDAHLAAFPSRLPSNAVSMETSGNLPEANPIHLPRNVSSPNGTFTEKGSLSSSRELINELPHRESESDEDKVLRLLAKSLKQESFSTRSVERTDKRKRNFKAKYRSPEKAVALEDFDVVAVTNERDKLIDQSSGRRLLSPAESFSTGYDKNFDGSVSHSSTVQRKRHEGRHHQSKIPRDCSNNQRLGASTFLSHELGGNFLRDKDKHSFYEPGIERKPIGLERVDFESSNSTGPFTMSSIAEDKKTKFLASVTRLKNEKLKELEIGLQQFWKQ